MRKLCALFALGARESVSCGLFSIGPRSLLSRNQAMAGKNPSVRTKKGNSLDALGQEPRCTWDKISRSRHFEDSNVPLNSGNARILGSACQSRSSKSRNADGVSRLSCVQACTSVLSGFRCPPNTLNTLQGVPFTALCVTTRLHPNS